MNDSTASSAATSAQGMPARLQSHWRRIVLGAAVCASVAVAVSFVAPRTYESSVTLIVSPPTFKGAPSRPAAPGANSETPQEGVGDLLPRTLPVEAYKAIALSPSLAAGVIDTLNLQDMDAGRLRKRLDVELVQMGSRSVQTGISYAPALLLHARADSPQRAEDLARTWADAFKKQVDGVARASTDDAFRLLEGLNTRFLDELRKSDEAIAEHQKAWNMELMKSEILSGQTLLTELKTQLKRLAIKLASAETRQKALEAELSAEPQKRTYFRAPSDDVYWLVDVANATTPEKGLRTEEANENYTQTRAALVTAREEVAGLQSEHEATVAKIDELDAELKPLVVNLADQTVARNRLEREQESLRVNYGLVRSEYERGRMARQALDSDIVLCGAATLPRRPIGPGHALVVLLAAVAGASLSAATLLLKTSEESVPPTPPDAPKKAVRRPKNGAKGSRVETL